MKTCIALLFQLHTIANAIRSKWSIINVLVLLIMTFVSSNVRHLVNGWQFPHGHIIDFAVHDWWPLPPTKKKRCLALSSLLRTGKCFSMTRLTLQASVGSLESHSYLTPVKYQCEDVTCELKECPMILTTRNGGNLVNYPQPSYPTMPIYVHHDSIPIFPY